MSNTSNAGLILLQMVFSLAILLMLLRFLFQLMRVDFYNPISQMVTRFSDPVLRPLRNFIPSSRKIDGASFVALFLLQYTHLFLIAGMQGLSADPTGLLLLSSAEILGLITSILFWAILILAILSWFQPSSYHPGIALLEQLTAPLMQPIRQVIPPTGGLDLSPIIALLVLKMAEFIIIAPLKDISALLLNG